MKESNAFCCAETTASDQDQLRPWQTNPEFVIDNEEEIAELLSILLQMDQQWNEKNIRPIGWEILCNVHYHLRPTLLFSESETSPPPEISH